MNDKNMIPKTSTYFSSFIRNKISFSLLYSEFKENIKIKTIQESEDENYILIKDYSQKNNRSYINLLSNQKTNSKQYEIAIGRFLSKPHIVNNQTNESLSIVKQFYQNKYWKKLSFYLNLFLVPTGYAYFKAKNLSLLRIFFVLPVILGCLHVPYYVGEIVVYSNSIFIGYLLLYHCDDCKEKKDFIEYLNSKGIIYEKKE